MPNQPLTYTDALDTMFGIVQGVWTNFANTLLGYLPQIRWQGKQIAGKPPANQIWARVSLQVVTDEQASLQNINGDRLYDVKGLLYIQLFCPRTDQDLQNGRQFAQIIQQTLRQDSADGNVWMSKAKIVEMTPTSLAYPITISVNFEYYSLNSTVNAVIPTGSGKKHFPVEAIDGIRTVFTFVGIPSDSTLYLIFWNGIEQDGLAQIGQTINFGTAPKAAVAGFQADTIVAVY